MAVRSGVPVIAVALTAFAGVVQATPQPTQQPRQSEALLASARAALGGEARLSAIRTIIVSGAIIRGAGHTKDFGTFKIQCRLPDAFVRFQAVSTVGMVGGANVDIGGIGPYGSGGVGPSFSHYSTTLGFEGRRLLYEPHVTTTRALVPATTADVQALLRQAQREFVRTTLALFAASFRGAPVQFADAPGDANATIVTGVGAPLVLTFDPQTHLPVRIDDFAYSDYRDVAGLKVAFRVIQMAGGRAFETREVRDVQLDAPLDPSAFRR